MQIGQFISNITNDLRALNIDDFISPKFIYYKSTSIVSDFMKKDSNFNKKLSRISEGWQRIDCFPMEEVPVTECCDLSFLTCKKLMRSKYKLPNTFTSYYGNVIEYVSNVLTSSFYDFTTPRTWNAIQKRKDKDRSKRYYFIIDNYIYIPISTYQEPSPEKIEIKAWFLEPWEVKKLNNKIEDKKECVNIYEMDMPIPEYLYNDVSKEIYNQLRSVYLQITPDEYPNLNNLDKSSNKDLQK